MFMFIYFLLIYVCLFILDNNELNNELKPHLLYFFHIWPDWTGVYPSLFWDCSASVCHRPTSSWPAAPAAPCTPPLSTRQEAGGWKVYNESCLLNLLVVRMEVNHFTPTLGLQTFLGPRRRRSGWRSLGLLLVRGRCRCRGRGGTLRGVFQALGWLTVKPAKCEVWGG